MFELETKERAVARVAHLYYIMMNLRLVRKLLLNHFQSSRSWTPWCWVKLECQLARKNERINFLLECKRQRAVPHFIQDKIRTSQLLPSESQRVIVSECNFGMQILAIVIRKEFQARKELRSKTVASRRRMINYSKADYLFTRNLKDQLVEDEVVESKKRLSSKLERLTCGRTLSTSSTKQIGTTKARVTCIATTISDSEYALLGKGPKFVPTQKKLTVEDLRKVESTIESTVNLLRRQQEMVPMEDPDAARNTNESTPYSLLTEPKVRALRDSIQHATQPPKMDAELEHRTRDLKAKIMRAYELYQPSQLNITKAEKSAFRELQKRDNIIIKRSDKSKSLVVMHEDVYRSKADVLLADTESYERTEMTSDALEKKISLALRKLPNLKALPRDIYRGLFPKNTRLPEFYGLPKIHKQDTPLRPVVAAYNGPLTPVSIFLERVLHQLLKFVPAHMENTAAALRSVKSFVDLTVLDGMIIVTMDVVALYPSIPIDEGISAVIEKLTQHENDIDLAGLRIEDIKTLLDLVLYNNYFKFGEKVYRQKKGIAMGNHLAPPLAIVFMDRLEREMLRTAKHKPESYDRYVDDGLMVWLHGEAKLVEFMDHCNHQNPNIRFTWDSTAQGNPVNFMDLQLTINQNNQLEYGLYQKPSNSGVNLNFNSCIPQQVKISVASQQFRRAETLSSNLTERSSSVDKIKTLLRENDYPENVIIKALEKTKKTPRRKRESTVTLQLPFCSDSLDKVVRRIVRKSRLPIQIAYRYGRNISNRMVKSALIPLSCAVHEKFQSEQRAEKRRRGKPCDDCIACQAGLKGHQCDQRGVVYLLRCLLCSEEYVGETQRPVRTRLQEHHNQARNRCKETPWGMHMLSHPEQIVGKNPVFAATILAIENNVTTRRTREAIEIRDRRPSINNSRGWTLE